MALCLLEWPAEKWVVTRYNCQHICKRNKRIGGNCGNPNTSDLDILRLADQHDKEYPSNTQQTWPERVFFLNPLTDMGEIGIIYRQGTIYKEWRNSDFSSASHPL